MKIELINTHRIKWLYDGCKSIDDMLAVLGEEITHLEELQELGVEVDGPSEDDYTRLSIKVVADSEEHKELLNRGFQNEEELE